MNIRPQRNAIESIVSQLRPFVLRGDERFVLSDGTELRVAGISRSGSDGAVAVLCQAGTVRFDSPVEPVSCRGAVLLRTETQAEREERNDSVGLFPTRVVEGLATEAYDELGRRTIYRIGVWASYAALIT